MINVIKKLKLFHILAIFAFSFSYTTSFVEAQSSPQSKNEKKLKYKKARALTTKTAKKMTKVYEALEEVDENGEPAPDMVTVREILTELRNDQANLKSYDRSVVWNSWGYVYFSDGEYEKAMNAY